MLRGGSVKDPYTLLRQKEQDVVRVRREIRALRIVIPLLADNEPASKYVLQRSSSARLAKEDSNTRMADLETYYPFVRHMRESERK